jgi:hypothetical protein
MWSLDKKTFRMELYNLCKFYFYLEYGDPNKDRTIEMFSNHYPLPKPLTKESKNEPFQLLQFALMYFPEQTEKAFFQYNYRWYAGKSPEEIKKRWEEEDKAILYAGGEWKECKSEWDRKVFNLPERWFSSLTIRDIPLGILSESERARAIGMYP